MKKLLAASPLAQPASPLVPQLAVPLVRPASPQTARLVQPVRLRSG